jgi:ThiF family
MALADYFRRSGVAIAQLLAGYDEDAIRERLEGVTVGIAASTQVSRSPEGHNILELVIRILARLYPRITLDLVSGDHDSWSDLARRINPQIEVLQSRADISVEIGEGAPRLAPVRIYVGANGWDGTVSSKAPRSVGTSVNPIGPAIAACLACSNVFRWVFRHQGEVFDSDAVLSGWEFESAPTGEEVPWHKEIRGDLAIVGVGAVGNAAVWTLSRAPLKDSASLVDPENVDIGNLQRYILAERGDVGKPKVEVAAKSLEGVEHFAYRSRWEEFVAERGSHWGQVLVSVDSARGRRAVQGALPRWIANAWTQPGDLGVSVHPSLGSGACLSCLYLPKGEVPSEDKVIAAALGIPGPESELRIRNLLHGDSPVPPDLLDQVANALDISRDALAGYEGRSLRDLYTEGICGGALIPLNRLGRPEERVHVPLAHQSALAGVLLAARTMRYLIHGADPVAVATRIDVMKPLATYLTQPISKDPRGICVCQDEDYLRAYHEKYA